MTAMAAPGEERLEEQAGEDRVESACGQAGLCPWQDSRHSGQTGYRRQLTGVNDELI